MSQSNPSRPSALVPMSLSLLVVSALAIVGASALAQMLIPQVSQAAAIRGGSIALGSFIATQLGLRVVSWRRRRSGRA